ETHAVTQPVAELVAEAGRLDDRAGGGVRVDAARARADAVETCLLASEAHGVSLLQALRQRAGREGAGAVRAVAVDLDRGVDDDGLAGTDLAVGRSGVRTCGVLAGRDDRLERGRHASDVVEELVEPPRELLLRAPREAFGSEPPQRLARDRTRRSDRLELGVVLDRPQRLDNAVARDGLQVARMEPRVLRVRDRVALEADPSRELI